MQTATATQEQYQPDTVTVLSGGCFLIETNDGHCGLMCWSEEDAFKTALTLFIAGTLPLSELQKIN